MLCPMLHLPCASMCLSTTLTSVSLKLSPETKLHIDAWFSNPSCGFGCIRPRLEHLFSNPEGVLAQRFETRPLSTGALGCLNQLRVRYPTALVMVRSAFTRRGTKDGRETGIVSDHLFRDSHSASHVSSGCGSSFACAHQLKKPSASTRGS